MKTKLNSFGETRKTGTPAFGIDLGTTNSCISVVQSGRIAIPIRLSSGDYTMPSCVMWKGDDKFVVGKEAYKSRFKPSVAYSTKRLIGKGENVELKYGRKKLIMTPTEVAAKILEALVEEASHLYPEIKDAIITVPAYFDNNQVKETIEAGRMAGLNVLQSMREPTAASHAYEIEGVGTREEVILVYDLGGGTFDVSALQVSVTGEVPDDFADLYGIDNTTKEEEEKSIYRVLSVGGNNKLGGDDIDEALLEIVLTKLPSLGLDPNLLSKEERGKLLLAVEKMKKMGPQSYTHPFTVKRKGETITVNIPVEPVDMINATHKVYTETRNIVTEVLSRDNLNSRVNRLVLVGGSTKSEILRDFLKRDFPQANVSSALNPDESVSLGAAIYAKKLKFGDDSVQTFDVLPIGIGVVSDEKLKIMIRSGQVVPCTQAEIFATAVDNQEEILVEVRQGNSSLVEKSVSLGNLLISGLEKGKAGEVKISVQLKIDANGLLSCTATHKGKSVKAEIVNILKGDTVKEETDKKEGSGYILRWERLKSQLDENKAKALDKIIDDVDRGIITFKEAKTKVGELLTVDKIKTTSRIENRDPVLDMDE